MSEAATADAAGSPTGFSAYLSSHPGKRATERYWLMYTPVWGAISAVVMLGGYATRWGDLECMIYGVVLAIGAVAGPLVLRAPEERELPIHRTAAFKMCLSVVGLAFGLNYSQTPFFWDVLHMHYGFGTDINIQNNPFFLYLVSVAYFSTYAALCGIAFRAIRRFAEGRSRLLAASAYVLAPMAMALLETVLNANPFMKSLFCYDDMQLMLWFGTLSYGVAFVFALPMWMAIDETPRELLPAGMVVVFLFAALYADVITLDVLRYNVAPHFTEVVEGANGLRDFGTSCLEPIVH